MKLISIRLFFVIVRDQAWAQSIFVGEIEYYERVRIGELCLSRKIFLN